MIFSHYATTKSATIQYTVEICQCMPTACVIYEDEKRSNNLCKGGCPNYSHKWSCPPFAPLFTEIILNWKKMYLIFMHVDLSQFSYIKSDYLKVKAANSILKSRADRFVREMARLHGSCISTGSCRLCKTCECKKGMPCAHPDLMAYSFEALGADAWQMVNDYFHKPLLSYQRQSLPEYASVVCAVLTNEDLSMKYLQDKYKETMN